MGNDIILVRHAHTAQIGPDAKAWPLSERGRAEAARLAQWPGWREVTAIVTSAEAKAIETAAAITAVHSYLVTLSPREPLGEVDRRGVFVADYEGAVAAFFSAPDASPYGWEPAVRARDRFAAAVEEAVAPYPDSSVAVVAHGLVFTLYLSTLLGSSPPDSVQWRALPFASIARVARLADGSRVLVHSFVASLLA